MTTGDNNRSATIVGTAKKWSHDGVHSAVVEPVAIHVQVAVPRGRMGRSYDERTSLGLRCAADVDPADDHLPADETWNTTGPLGTRWPNRPATWWCGIRWPGGHRHRQLRRRAR